MYRGPFTYFSLLSSELEYIPTCAATTDVFNSVFLQRNCLKYCFRMLVNKNMPLARWANNCRKTGPMTVVVEPIAIAGSYMVWNNFLNFSTFLKNDSEILHFLFCV